MNDNVSTAAELRADFEDEYLGAPPEYVKNTNGERVAVASAAEKRALEGGIVVLFSLAESYEARIAELEKSLDRTHANLDDRIAALEAKLDGLLGMGGGLDTALAKRDQRIEVQERRLGALEYLVDEVRDEVTGPLAWQIRGLVAALKADSEPAATPAPVDPLAEFSANTPTAEQQEADAKAAETVTLERKFAEELHRIVVDVEFALNAKGDIERKDFALIRTRGRLAAILHKMTTSEPAATPAPVDWLSPYTDAQREVALKKQLERVGAVEKALFRVAQLLGNISEFASRSTVWAAIEDARIEAYMALEDVSRDEAKNALGIPPFIHDSVHRREGKRQ